jgi:hypothetical protein
MKNETNKPKARSPKKPSLPSGWNEERVGKVLAHYENQTDDEAVAEDEAAFNTEGQTVVVVPTNLVPSVRRLIARGHERSPAKRTKR